MTHMGPEDLIQVEKSVTLNRHTIKHAIKEKMSIRDQFAIAFATSILGNTDETMDNFAERAYNYADEMMEYRSREMDK